jgi:hypothetical protein
MLATPKKALAYEYERLNVWCVAPPIEFLAIAVVGVDD